MCLFSTTNKMIRAEQDIVCYKRMCIMEFEGQLEFFTPYQLKKVPIDVILGKNPFKAEGKKEISDFTFDAEYSIHGGFIHTYAFCRDAMEFADLEEEASGKDVDEIIIQCIIPKGTFYIKGKDSYGDVGFAARKIKFTPSEDGIIKELIKKYEQN